MTTQEKMLQTANRLETELEILPNKEEVYEIFKRLVVEFPNDMQLGEIVRALFTKNKK
jgi:AAA+ superfamily predicted ATPase